MKIYKRTDYYQSNTGKTRERIYRVGLEKDEPDKDEIESEKVQ